MYYHIDKLRGVTLNRIPDLEVERKSSLNKFVNSSNLFQFGIFNKIYTFGSALYIDKDAFIEYMSLLSKSFGLKMKSSVYDKCQVPTVEESFDIETIVQMRELQERCKIIGIELNKKRADYLAALNNPLPTDLEDKKLLAIDFEFIPNGDIMEPVEMGISIQHNGMRTSFNYSFVNTQQNKFNFGETVNIDKSQLAAIFKEHFVDVDYMVGHNILTELGILKANGFDDYFFENVKFIDTSYVTKNEFHFLNTDHVKHQTASLRTSLRTLDIPYLRLHVAGNDASYTLDVLNQLISYKLSFQRRNAKQKIQVKGNFKKQ